MGIINWPLLRKAVKIVQDIPDKQLNMNTILYAQHDIVDMEHACGSIGCAIGWLGLNPEMQEHGLVTRFIAESGTFNGTTQVLFNGKNVYYVHAAMELFGLSYMEASGLFSSIDAYESTTPRNDKRTFMDRVSRLFGAYGRPLEVDNADL